MRKEIKVGKRLFFVTKISRRTTDSHLCSPVLSENSLQKFKSICSLFLYKHAILNLDKINYGNTKLDQSVSV